MRAGRRAPAGAPRPQGGTSRWAETRIAPDGSVLTLTQFLRRYGSYNHWNRARRQRKAVMRLEPQAPPSDCSTPRGRTAGLDGGLRSPEAGGLVGGEHASPWVASAQSQHSGPVAGCALDAVPLPPLRPAPLIRQEHAHSQAAGALAALAAAETALRLEREARVESETTLKRERSLWQANATVHKTTADALLRTLARERVQQKDCAAALTVAEAALRSEQAARSELQEELSRMQKLHQSATLVEKALLREIRRLGSKEEDARRELQAAAARADQLRQLLLAAEEHAQAAQQRERDERSRASRLLFQAAQRAAERIERERATARGGDPAPDTVVGVGDRISLGGAGAQNSRDAEPRRPKNPAAQRINAQGACVRKDGQQRDRIAAEEAVLRRQLRPADGLVAPPSFMDARPHRRVTVGVAHRLLPPQRPAGRKTLIFDLDETLIKYLRNTCDGVEAGLWFRQGAVRMLQRLRRKGAEIVLWTAGGSYYAEAVATLLDPSNVVEHIVANHGSWFTDATTYTKNVGVVGRQRSETILIENNPQCAAKTPECTLLVPDYEGGAQRDTVLRDLEVLLTGWLGAACSSSDWLAQNAEAVLVDTRVCGMQRVPHIRPGEHCDKQRRDVAQMVPLAGGAVVCASDVGTTSRSTPAHEVLFIDHICFWLSAFAPRSWAPVCSKSARFVLGTLRLFHEGWRFVCYNVARFQGKGIHDPIDEANIGPGVGSLHWAILNVQELLPAVRTAFPVVHGNDLWGSRWVVHMEQTINMYEEMRLQYRAVYVDMVRALGNLRSVGRTVERVLAMFDQRTAAALEDATEPT